MHWANCSIVSDFKYCQMRVMNLWMQLSTYGERERERDESTSMLWITVVSEQERCRESHFTAQHVYEFTVMFINWSLYLETVAIYDCWVQFNTMSRQYWSSYATTALFPTFMMIPFAPVELEYVRMMRQSPKRFLIQSRLVLKPRSPTLPSKY